MATKEIRELVLARFAFRVAHAVTRTRLRNDRLVHGAGRSASPMRELAMTIPSSIEPMETIGAIARCRYIVLKRADEILREQPTIPVAERADLLPDMSGLLMTSLEELKVAEEELRLQNSVLEAQRAVIDSRVRHYRQLFLYSPAPAIVTDVYATIQEVNLSAAGLFRREARHLERKPLVALLMPEYREEFRHQLSRVTAVGGVRDWRLVIKRVGDLPLEAHATVKVVPELGATGSGLLYWMLAVPNHHE
jgi:PAS domain S-box-containing protein